MPVHVYRQVKIHFPFITFSALVPNKLNISSQGLKTPAFDANHQFTKCQF